MDNSSDWKVLRYVVNSFQDVIRCLRVPADSLYPTMEAYHKTWATPLSVTSVFNM
jgi:hypothetical protein